ncbi:MAG: SRPBCC family protein [Myxococcota bacterium]
MTTRETRLQDAYAQRAGAALAFGLAGITTGAALMYIYDPASGRRRRAIAKDKVRRKAHDVTKLAEKAAKDAQKRARGAVAEGRQRFSRGEVVDDAVLHERVRAQLGRSCAHPRAITVRCEGGVVELTGPCLKDEHHDIVRRAAKVHGVREVKDLLEVHPLPDVPQLEGARKRGGPRQEWMQRNWTPALRVASTGAGILMMLIGAMRRRALSGALGAVGAGLCARAISNRPLRELVAGARIELRKSLFIDAPIGDVYRFFARPENLPRFMAHVEDVRALEDGGYHWQVEGPARTHFSWDASFDAVENASVRWRSVPGSMVANEGAVLFEEEGHGTRVVINLVYRPPGGALGHSFARALGADPRARMDDDLLRLKSLLEEGRATGRRGTVTREEVERVEEPPSAGDTGDGAEAARS